MNTRCRVTVGSEAEIDKEEQGSSLIQPGGPLDMETETLSAESEIAETVAEAARTKGKSQLWSVLKNAEFQIFTWSQAVSLFGDKLDYMALLAMIAFYADKYGWQSSRAISYLSVIVALPVVLFGPLAGILVDRWDRRKVMVVCDSLRTILVLAVPLVALATSNLYLIYTIAFLVFLCGLFFNTSRMSIIPNLVGSDHLLGANSFMSFVGRVATFLGMFLGGLIVDWKWWAHVGIKPAWTAGFYIDALSYMVSVFALLIIFRRLGSKWHQSILARRQGEEVKLFITQQARMIHEVREAFNLVRGQPSVLFVYCSVVMMVILGAAVFVLYIPIIQGAKELGAGLGLGTQGVGFVGAIGSVGLVLSSMGYGLLGHKLKKHIVMLTSFLVLGLVGAGLAVSRSFAPVAPLVFIAGLALSPVYIGMDTLLHESVPEAARGRIFSTRDWLLHLAFAVSAFVIGQMTNFVSTRRLLFAVSAIIAVASIVGFLLTRGKKVG
ncbi:MFS transporter [candidate division WOR-3 bacterium]|uniref:MFS transporter n=1 Tax=candidate division WOR-3 bacterium TaxID=2052148 RepID=A0A937XGX1_UNCW3|nr:MFS transporter [candidate division WOR-3 bacterium]